MTDRLVLSIAEAADALGLSEDLVYAMTSRGELPCLRFGRRRVVPRRAIELVIEHSLAGFDPDALATRLLVPTSADGQVSLSSRDEEVFEEVAPSRLVYGAVPVVGLVLVGVLAGNGGRRIRRQDTS